MNDGSLRSKNTGPYLAVSFLTLLVFIIQYLARSADDNRLTSWAWVFQSVDATMIYGALVFCIVISYALSRFSFPPAYAPVLLFLLSFAASSLFWGEPEAIVDASRYFTQAKHLEMYGIKYFIREWGKGIEAWTDLPAMPFLYGLIFKFLGEHRVYIQIFTTALFSLTVVVTYHIGKDLWDEDAGLYGGMLLLGMPYLYTQTPLLLVDVPSMFFLTLAVYLFIKALSRGGALLVPAASLAIFLAFFAKYTMWMMLSVLAVIVVVRHVESRKEEAAFIALPPLTGLMTRPYVRRALFIALISSLFIGTALILKSDVITAQIRLLLSYQRPGLGRWTESFISTFLFQIHPFVTAAAMVSLYAAVREKDAKYLIIGYLVILVLLLQIRRIRYIIMVFPMLALTASYGLRRLKDAHLGRFIALCAVLSSLTVAGLGYLPFLRKVGTVNLQRAGGHLDKLPRDAVQVYTLTDDRSLLNPAIAVPLLDYFTDKRIVYDYKKDLPLPEETLARSSLRFTWDYTNPAYYAGPHDVPDADAAAVIISHGADGPIPERLADKVKNFRNMKIFETHDGVFQYNPVVRVYSETAQNN